MFYETKQIPMGIMLVIQGEYGKFIQVSHTKTFFSFYGVEGLTKDDRWALTPRDVG